MEQLVYNGFQILDLARKRQSQAIVHGVTWNCASEFEADANKPISFIEDGAFMQIPRNVNRNLRLQAEIKTIQDHSILFYNTGPPSRTDHFAVEIWEGKIKVTLKLGASIIENQNNVFINDGRWHKFTIRVTPASIDITVNNSITNAVIPRSHFIDFDKMFYIGGLEASKKARANMKDLKTTDFSYKGCIKHIMFGEKKTGLPDAYISTGLYPGCLWDYTCLNKECIDKNNCFQDGVDCYNDTFESSYMNLAEKLELLALEPLEALEGGIAKINVTNLHVILDYPKYNILDTGVMFNVTEGPLHGAVSNNLVNYKEISSFTLNDLFKEKIFYKHDGSENFKDQIVMDLIFVSENIVLPPYLQGKFKFTLYIEIEPVNDPPELRIPSTNIFTLAQGSRRTFSNDLLNVNDPDTPLNRLFYNTNNSNFGHFEYDNKPGIPITTFSLTDVENGQVILYHHSNSSNDSYISFEVTDGILNSEPVKLRVQTFPQMWELQNNTGLLLMHEASAYITSYNLSFISNVNLTDNAEYHVLKGPEFGQIEIERNGVWKKSFKFSSEDMKRYKVRYRHLSSAPSHDEFEYRTSLNMSRSYVFHIMFAKCELIILRNAPLNLNSSEEATLTIYNVRYLTKPVQLPPNSITYLIIRDPTYGYLYFADSRYKLGYFDTFTQEDIISRNIKYRLHRKSYSPISDSILFSVIAPGCRNVTGNVTIMHQPSNETLSRVHTVIERLQVEEGGRTNIAVTHLNIHSDSITDLFFNITTPPKHGILQVVKENSERNKTNYFTLNELTLNQLYYVHDDSETRTDEFEFMALSREEENFQYVETIHIDILLKNDNTPIREVEKIFYVVVGGQKLLTSDDLKYVDPDIDTKPSDIVYTYKDLRSGGIYSAKNTSVEFQKFTQSDLDRNLVLFKHNGTAHFKINLWVTDGSNFVQGSLEVKASAPFISVYSNRKLYVKHGAIATIKSDHLSYMTNLYAVDEDVVYEITSKPKFGKIVYGEKFEDILRFTHAQLKKGYIFYANEVHTESVDKVGIKVQCKEAVTNAHLLILMLPPSYWEPLALKTIRTLMVEESTSAIINKQTLEVSQPNVDPSMITFYVTEFPKYGYITILPSTKDSDEQTTNMRSFTQSVLNENRIVYIQSVANETSDRIIFNVTSSIIWLNNVVLDVQVIPEHLYLGSNALTVYEGGVVLISPVNLFTQTHYYKSKVTDYILLELPKHGCVQIRKSCTKLAKFSYKELKAGVVHYAHDGTENLSDEVKIIGIAGEKRSAPLVLPITVLPINDQMPRVINNTGLTMWEGGIAIITNSMLAAVDADRPEEVLRYHILGCWWGNVTPASDRHTPLHYFTQEWINKNLVVFRHLNGSEAEFTFKVSDGLHSTKEYTFLIKTKPVTLNIKIRPLHIFPLQRKYLTSNYIQSTVSDPQRNINYEVIVPPTLGRLMLESDTSGIYKVVNSFTQDDLNEKRIFYEHTHPFANLYANDSFVFNVKSHLARPLVNQRLTIDISVSSGGLDAFVSIPKVNVNEGGIVSITMNLSNVVFFLENHAGLRSPIIHASAMNPQHGTVFLQNNSNLTTYTQQQLESGQVLYQHDHSDSLGDNIHFSLYLLPGYILLCNVTVPIVVNPINDQPFTLVTAPPHFKVVQGENHTITKSELCTEDADTEPGDLKYDIITGPVTGSIVILPEAIAVTHFTQADINDNRLVYIHNGSGLRDTINLRVWDGKFQPVYTVFSVEVIPISLNISAGPPAFLQQGSNVVHLSESQFVIKSNANWNNIKFGMRIPPRHGLLYVRDEKSSKFTYRDVVEKNVMYMQRDMAAANDSFSVFAGMLSGNTSIGNVINIVVIVQPLMQIGQLTVLTGENNRITLSVLDATPLAKLTNSNPRYNLIRRPKYGEIRKILRSSGENRNVLDTAVNAFTHEEVQSGLIYYVVDDIEVGWNGIQDRLGFVIAVPNMFQPALGELKIQIKSPMFNEIYSTLAGPNDPAGHEGGMHFASPNMTRDYFLIVSMVAGVVILGVAVIIVIKCRSLEPEELNKEEQCLQPIPLPRPPDRLMAASPPLKHAQSGFASPLLTALPQCKVTPLNRNELDSHTRYPYGVDDHPDEWSSCDTSDAACPSRNIMLRRNQYWV
ncbi:putative chondroitin sulfate proteoglycan [Trypoxylus dichotomus]